MKLSAALSPFWDLLLSIQVALLPTLRSILANPTLLFSPSALTRIFMAYIWEGGFGDGTDENGRLPKTQLITSNAYGVVLDLGAGHGHTMQYLDRTKVTHYIALEPNAQMHPFIRASASSAGFSEADGTLVVIACGAEESHKILSELPNNRPVDTIISVLTLCTIPSPEKTLHNLVRDVLRADGGVFLFYEHVLSEREDVQWWQRAWTPVWTVPFDGCRLDRATHRLVRDLRVKGGLHSNPETLKDTGVEGEESPWREGELWGKEGESEENLFWHQAGRFVKK